MNSVVHLAAAKGLRINQHAPRRPHLPIPIYTANGAPPQVLHVRLVYLFYPSAVRLMTRRINETRSRASGPVNWIRNLVMKNTSLADAGGDKSL